MSKSGQWFAGFVVAGLAIAFILSYREIYVPRVSPPPTPSVPMTPVAAAEVEAHSLSLAVAFYHERHGRFPTVAEFWRAAGHTPIKNTVTGSDKVVAMSRDLDASAVGWVYDEATGAVYPGGTFGATTLPTGRPGT